jgi:Na+/melibiose symporter-like transporter
MRGMLNLEFFRNRRFSAAVGSVGLVTFGLFGTLFVMTQFLQFGLGHSALQAGVRVLPAAGAIAIVAPLSTLLVRAVGTKLTVGAGLLVVAGGLWQLSTASAATTTPASCPA